MLTSFVKERQAAARRKGDGTAAGGPHKTNTFERIGLKMGGHALLAVALVAIGVVIGVGVATWYYCEESPEPEKQRERERERSYQRQQEQREREYRYREARTHRAFHSTAYSNPRNNHDNQKRMHATESEAHDVIDRMQMQGVPDSERLNAYYNSELGGWFVGRSSW